MPITAKLSREFYERFGDKVVNEMIDLFNRIDENSRADLRLLNEQNAGRFDAKFDSLDERFRNLDDRLDRLDDRLDDRIDRLDDRLSARIGSVEITVGRIEKQLSDFPAILEKALHNQTRWMIGAWGILMASQIALWWR